MPRRARHHETFKPDTGTKSVHAESAAEGDKAAGYSFTGASGNYAWLGDVDAMKAQGIAVDLSGTLAQLGIDGQEGLRRGDAALLEPAPRNGLASFWACERSALTVFRLFPE